MTETLDKAALFPPNQFDQVREVYRKQLLDGFKTVEVTRGSYACERRNSPQGEPNPLLCIYCIDQLRISPLQIITKANSFGDLFCPICEIEVHNNTTED